MQKASPPLWLLTRRVFFHKDECPRIDPGFFFGCLSSQEEKKCAQDNQELVLSRNDQHSVLRYWMESIDQSVHVNRTIDNLTA